MKKIWIGLALGGIVVGVVILMWRPSSPQSQSAFQMEPPLRLPEPEELGTVLPPEAFDSPTAKVEEPRSSEREEKKETPDLSPPADELKRMEREGIVSY